MTPRGTQLFAQWCVTLCILVNFLLIPTQGFALTAEEPSPSPSPSDDREEPSPSPSGDRKVMLGRDRGAPGTKVTVQGSGYGACGDSVNVKFLRDNAGSENADVDKGKFKTDLIVPKDAKPGPLVIKVEDGCTTVTKKFTVVAPTPTNRPPPPAAPPPPAPSPTTAPLPSLSPSPSSPAEPLPDNFAKNDYIERYGTVPGKLVENMPKQMRVDEVEWITARITRNISDKIYEDLQGRGTPTPHNLRITAHMEVKMIADPGDFDIRPISSSILSVSEPYAEWRWAVKPISSGVHKLTIRATLINEGQPIKDLGWYNYDIEVTVNPMYLTAKWILNNLDTVVAALGISAAGVFATLYQRLRRRLNSSNRRIRGAQKLDE